MPTNFPFRAISFEFLGATGRGSLFCAAAGFLASVAVPVHAQDEPNFSGVWFSVTGTHHQAKSSDTVFGGTAALPLPGGELPLKEPYATRYQEGRERMRAIEESGGLGADTESLCFPDGMPKMMRAILPLEFIQTPSKLVVISEEMAQVRRIYIGEEFPPLDEIEPTYNGYSVGKWFGDELQITTLGVRDDLNFLEMPFSSQLKIVERMRLLNPDLLELRITIEDPEILYRPYEFTWTYDRDDSHKISEYICDGNRYKLNSDGTLNLEIEEF